MGQSPTGVYVGAVRAAGIGRHRSRPRLAAAHVLRLCGPRQSARFLRDHDRHGPRGQLLEHLVGSCAPSRFGFQAPEFETKKRLIESSGINPVQHSFHVRRLASGRATGDVFLWPHTCCHRLPHSQLRVGELDSDLKKVMRVWYAESKELHKASRSGFDSMLSLQNEERVLNALVNAVRQLLQNLKAFDGRVCAGWCGAGCSRA